MLRHSLIFLYKTAGCVSDNSSVYRHPTTENMPRSLEGVFAVRRNPTSLFESNMHSNTLSDHPLTHRARRNEVAYRQRRLTERGYYEQAAIEEDARRRDKKDRGSEEVGEYYSVLFFAALGYLLAHKFVFRWYYPDDIRMDYSLDSGYLEEVAARRSDLAAVDALVGVSVLEDVYSTQKERVKRTLG
ncbi:putative transmembrane protein [Trypanosoma vivax]|uniref:Transmembrane protein n=1 Tax=Trypanosoma vivax (strain Y486) TaxID=1055687 RepID=G0TR12_TRYVY|nr:putative transmembrane protein [Trypanosoma vivax]CCC46376.1 conserved hypothetical protein [Trypanosoma vivax Y486]